MDFEVSRDDVENAIDNFLMYTGSQRTHVEKGNIELSAYVGRHLDQALIGVEFAVSMWLQNHFPQGEGAAAQRSALERLHGGAPKRPDEKSLMARLIRATEHVLNDELMPALLREDAVQVALAWYLARRWFTKYRVLKWRWLEQHAGAVPPYQFFES